MLTYKEVTIILKAHINAQNKQKIAISVTCTTKYNTSIIYKNYSSHFNICKILAWISGKWEHDC